MPWRFWLRDGLAAGERLERRAGVEHDDLARARGGLHLHAVAAPVGLHAEAAHRAGLGHVPGLWRGREALGGDLEAAGLPAGRGELEHAARGPRRPLEGGLHPVDPAVGAGGGAGRANGEGEARRWRCRRLGDAGRGDVACGRGERDLRRRDLRERSAALREREGDRRRGAGGEPGSVLHLPHAVGREGIEHGDAGARARDLLSEPLQPGAAPLALQVHEVTFGEDAPGDGRQRLRVGPAGEGRARDAARARGVDAEEHVALRRERVEDVAPAVVVGGSGSRGRPTAIRSAPARRAARRRPRRSCRRRRR